MGVELYNHIFWGNVFFIHLMKVVNFSLTTMIACDVIDKVRHSVRNFKVHFMLVFYVHTAFNLSGFVKVSNFYQTLEHFKKYYSWFITKQLMEFIFSGGLFRKVS